MSNQTVTTPAGRTLRIRVRSVGQNFGIVGQVLAGNGRVIHETATRPTGFTEAAEKDALAWAERQA